jgi:hypothetical protein
LPDGAELAAENEAEARYTNEGLEKAQEYMQSGELLQIICECGQAGCGELIAITRPEYEALRSDPTHFAIAPDHMMPEIDRIVGSNDRFVTVEKREGTPAEIAEETDPRD